MVRIKYRRAGERFVEEFSSASSAHERAAALVLQGGAVVIECKPEEALREIPTFV